MSGYTTTDALTELKLILDSDHSASSKLDSLIALINGTSVGQGGDRATPSIIVLYRDFARRFERRDRDPKSRAFERCLPD